jgi:hypothetical protein
MNNSELKKAYRDAFPKPRTGHECKKVNCKYYEAYSHWSQCIYGQKFCMECKHSSLSQYTPKKVEAN